MDHMLQHAVMVHVEGVDVLHAKHRNRPFYKQKNGFLSYSASGVYLGRHPSTKHGVVVVAASVLGPFLQSTKETFNARNGFDKPLVLARGTSISLRFEASDDQVAWSSAQLKGGLVVPQLVRTLKGLFGETHPALSYGGRTLGTLAVLYVDPSQIPTSFQNPFEANCRCFLPHPAGPARSRAPVVSAATQRGDCLWVVSSAFGLVCPRVLQNSVSTGIVSNQLPGLLLTDARCLAGAEGAPAFGRSGKLVGIVIESPFDFVDNHDVENDAGDDATHVKNENGHNGSLPPGSSFGLVLPTQSLVQSDSRITSVSEQDSISLANFLKYLRQGPAALGGLSVRECSALRAPSASVQMPTPPWLVSTFSTRQFCSVGLVSVRGAWGSGVIINSNGHVVTCAHILQSVMPSSWKRNTLQSPYPMHLPQWSVRIRLSCNMIPPAMLSRFWVRDGYVWVDAEVLWVSSCAVDFAMLQIAMPDVSQGEFLDIPNLPELRLGRELAQGDAVAVVGHGGFGPSKKLTESVSCGCVAKVVTMSSKQGRRAVLIQTTAMVSRCMHDSGARHCCVDFCKHPQCLPKLCVQVIGGHSGGALIDDQGRFCGLVTSNACGNDSNSALEYLNFVLPVSFFADVVEFVAQRKNIPGLGQGVDVGLIDKLNSSIGPGYSQVGRPSLNAKSTELIEFEKLWQLDFAEPPPEFGTSQMPRGNRDENHQTRSRL